MPSSLQEFVRGMRHSLPVALASTPFALLFGALAVENGLSIGDAVLMSATVYAGASQLVGIELFGQAVAPWLIVASIFAVNFRHVLYSAAIGRRVPEWSSAKKWFGFFFLIDPQYAEAERKGEQGGTISFAWFMGMAIPIYLFWNANTLIGAVFGAMIPDPHALGLDFLLPIYFLGLVMSFRGRPLWFPVVAASAVTSILAYFWVGSPWHVSIGAVAGVVLAAMTTPVSQEKAS